MIVLSDHLLGLFIQAGPPKGKAREVSPNTVSITGTMLGTSCLAHLPAAPPYLTSYPTLV